ncbi:MAG: hypothetical protein ABI254_12240 [Chthoniobacterales bacterium]
MKRDTQIAVSVMLLCLLLSACSGVGKSSVIDTRPIGNGLEFLGMAGVLIALIIVFGRYIKK